MVLEGAGKVRPQRDTSARMRLEHAETSSVLLVPAVVRFVLRLVVGGELTMASSGFKFFAVLGGADGRRSFLCFSNFRQR